MGIIRRAQIVALPVILLALSACASTNSVPDAATERVHRIDVAEEIELHVLESGGGSAPPLVLVPGWSTDAEMWRGQIEAFSSEHRVIAIDPRSQGQSTITIDGNTPEQRARDLRVILSELHVSRPVLVGWSQGVQDTAAYVEQYGASDLRGIVLVDAALSRGSAQIEQEPAVYATQEQRLTIYRAHQREYLQGMWQAIAIKPQPEGLIERLVEAGMATPPSIGAEMLTADLYGRDRSAALAGIRLPVLIVASSSSPELAQMRAMAATLPNGEIIVVEDAGHAVFLDQPELFNSTLAQFLNNLP